MTPYYQANGITIFHGDCRDALSQLAQVHLVATDPAYRVIGGGSNKGDKSRPSGILAKNDGKIFKHNDIKTSEYAGLLFDVLHDPAHLYLFINDLNLRDALNDFDAVGFEFHGLLNWYKTNATPSRWYMADSEPILFFRKGAAFPINNPSAKATLRYPSVPPAEKKHPTQKPVLLMMELIQNSSQPGQTVLDPFCGSGSTLIAGLRSGRRAIGIEIDEQYCEVAASWVEEEASCKVRQGMLFQQVA